MSNRGNLQGDEDEIAILVFAAMFLIFVGIVAVMYFCVRISLYPGD